MLQTGDIVFFKKTDDFISKSIASLTKSDFTHVGLMLDDKRMIEANRFIKTHIIPFEFDPKLHQAYRVNGITKEMQKNMYRWAMYYKGYSYDYLQIAGLFLRCVFHIDDDIFNSANKLICSELIDYTFYRSGVQRKNLYDLGDVTPGNLLEVYSLCPLIYN